MHAKKAWFHFDAELEDYLPATQRGLALDSPFFVAPSVKDAIEALGVPHPEVDVIVVRGRSVGWEYRLAPGDEVWVYAHPRGTTVAPLRHLRPVLPEELRFVLDVHLGKLARNLRMLGFDTLYDRRWNDQEIIEAAAAERRLIATRDVELLKNKRVIHGYWVRATHPRVQIQEVIERFDLRRRFSPFTRCMACNGRLMERSDDVAHRAPPRVRERARTFRECPSCGKLYWEGTHVRHMRGLIEALRRSGQGTGGAAPGR